MQRLLLIGIIQVRFFGLVMQRTRTKTRSRALKDDKVTSTPSLTMHKHILQVISKKHTKDANPAYMADPNAESRVVTFINRRGRALSNPSIEVLRRRGLR